MDKYDEINGFDDEEDDGEDISDVLEIWSEYNNYVDALDNSDYEINKPQMAKLINLYDFFVKALENTSGKVELHTPVPKKLHGGLDIYCRLFYIYFDDIVKFSEVMRGASAVSIDAMTDGTVNISITVPNVYKHK